MKLNKNKLPALIGFILALVIGFIVVWYLTSEKDVKNQLQSLATKLNDECPVMVDNDTGLDSVAVSPTITFF